MHGSLGIARVPPTPLSSAFFIGCAACSIPGWHGLVGRGGKRGRESVVERPYIIVYEVDEPNEEVVILAVVHGRQNR
jgi:hypothetical protein